MASSPPPEAIRRLVYKSVPTDPAGGTDLGGILAASRLNNGLEGVSGILLATPFLYLQVLEGSSESVQYLYDRIRMDPRHISVSVLADDMTERRAFGDWSMASLDDDRADAVRRRIDRFLADADERVRSAFHDALGSA